MKIFFALFMLFSVVGTTQLRAQAKTVSGQVLNEKREPVGGATVAEKGREGNASTTDIQGKFTLQLKGESNQIVISIVGYIADTITVGNRSVIAVNLKPDAKGLDEVVIVGFGRQKRITSTGAVSTIKAEEIKTIPTASIQNTLAGRLPGFFSQQRSGQPGADAAEFFIRGINSLTGDNRPLIIVDDIQYDYTQLAQLNANEIETISILKDAATTSIYGLKGANGVLVVTTNRGRIGRPKINFLSEVGMNKVIRMPTFLDAYTTALLRNEGTINDAYGQTQPPTLPFTPDDLQKFKDGSDPYGHPNVNWVKELLKNASTQSRYNIDVSGGNNLVKYFTSLGYFGQNGILKDAQQVGDKVNVNYYYQRFNYRSNLDFTPTKTLKIRFDMNGRFETTNTPAGTVDGGGLFYEISAFRYLSPYAMPLVNPNGTYGYGSYAGAITGAGAINPIYRLANGGYRKTFNNNYNIVAGADQRLDFITTGLSAKVNISYAGNNNEFRQLTRSNMPAYRYVPATNSYIVQSAYRTPVYSVSSGNSSFNSTSILQASLNYDRTFGRHHFTGLLLLNQNTYTNLAVVPVNYRGTTGRLDYDYKRKYLLGLTLARNGNDLFRKDRRYGIFPAISFGYNLSEESFFKNLFPVFDLFKIRGSYGLVGSDASYPGVVNSTIQYSTTGTNFYGGTTVEGALVNPDITWEKEKKTDIGIEANMFKGKITLSGSYFYNYRYDQLIAQGDVPLIVGQTLPSKNIGKSENRGFDGVITYRDRVGKFNWSVSTNASYAKNKIVYVSEAPDYAYQARTGRTLELILGYRNLGFYQLADFDADGKVKKGIAAPTWSVIQPGDIRYADMNGDGVINEADKTYLARPNLPTTNIGAEFSFGYKNFSLRALLQGAFGYSVQVIAEGAGDAFNSNLRPWNLERWTPATAATATYPRMGLNTNVNNISYLTVSDFWIVNADYVRLKSLEMAYQLPQSWLKRTKIVQNARFYLSGYNLLTFQNLGHFQQDAEIANGVGNAYPNTANYIMGLQVGF